MSVKYYVQLTAVYTVKQIIELYHTLSYSSNRGFNISCHSLTTFHVTKAPTLHGQIQVHRGLYFNDYALEARLGILLEL